MCYQLPASITKDGLPIPGGPDINPLDASFCGQLYPPTAPPPPPPEEDDRVVLHVNEKKIVVPASQGYTMVERAKK
jgi:hypothetical protein